jgi:hypothetical protein
MEKLPSVLGELRDSQVLSRKSSYQANATQWINLSHQWLGLLDRTNINEVYNATPALKMGKSLLEAFSQTAIRPKCGNILYWLMTDMIE